MSDVFLFVPTGNEMLLFDAFDLLSLPVEVFCYFGVFFICCFFLLCYQIIFNLLNLLIIVGFCFILILFGYLFHRWVRCEFLLSILFLFLKGNWIEAKRNVLFFFVFYGIGLFWRLIRTGLLSGLVFMIKNCFMAACTPDNQNANNNPSHIYNRIWSCS